MERMQRLGRIVAIGVLMTGGGVFAAWAGEPEKPVTGQVKLDGSSTVAPITMAAAELFQSQQPKVQVTVGISGTGGGFKKFLEEKSNLRTDISDASRPIKESEMTRAKELGVEFIEVPIGLDGIAIMVNPKNTFVDSLTVEELKKIWQPDSTINNWKDVRHGFPDQPLRLYGPGTDNGTFDYFTEAIVGKEKASRSDYTASATPTVLVQGIAGDEGALGYFGFSYYENNRDKLKLVAVDNGNGKAVTPDLEKIKSGEYKPLSRPLFLYVNKQSFQRPEVRAFLKYFFENARSIVENPRVGYVAISDDLYRMSWQRLESGTTGSAMSEAKGATDLKDIFGKH